MGKLPRKRNKRQNLIVNAVWDYFGKMNAEEKKSATKISLWLMGRKKRLEPLTEEERGALERIQANFQDKTYASLLGREGQ